MRTVHVHVWLQCYDSLLLISYVYMYVALHSLAQRLHAGPVHTIVYLQGLSHKYWNHKFYFWRQSLAVSLVTRYTICLCMHVILYIRKNKYMYIYIVHENVHMQYTCTYIHECSIHLKDKATQHLRPKKTEQLHSVAQLVRHDTWDVGFNPAWVQLFLWEKLSLVLCCFVFLNVWVIMYNVQYMYILMPNMLTAGWNGTCTCTYVHVLGKGEEHSRQVLSTYMYNVTWGLELRDQWSTRHSWVPYYGFLTHPDRVLSHSCNMILPMLW